jgi:cyclic beta-1,2-glucan synthetase
MHRVTLESVLGVTVRGGDTLEVRPRIPDGWPGARVALRLPADGARYEVEIVNARGRAEMVVAVESDGVPCTPVDGAAVVRLVRDGRPHHVRVVLGGR